MFFGDFLQNGQGFIGFIYEVSGFIKLNIELTQLEILECNNNLEESYCKNCNQESCVENCCNYLKLTKKRRNQGTYYIQANNTQINVTYCPTYYKLVGNQCVWNSSVLEVSFYDNKSTFTDLSGNVKLLSWDSTPLFQQSRGLYFDGTNPGFLIPEMVKSPDNIIIFWFNPNQSSSYLELFYGWYLSIFLSNMVPYFYEFDYIVGGAISLNNGTWYQIIATSIAGDSLILKIIINGVQSYTTSYNYADNVNYKTSYSYNFWIGHYFSGWIVYFLYAPSHTAFASLTFTGYSSAKYLYMCNISYYYDGNTCQPCSSEGILDCYGPLYNNALSCQYFMNLCNDACFCNNNYFWNGKTCLPCNSSCLTCNGPLTSDCLLNATDSINKICTAGYFYQDGLCASITNLSCLACDPSCSTCSGSGPNNCASCMQNAILQSNNTCLCSQGWSGVSSFCVRNTFKAILSLNASDVATLTFSEPLAYNLILSNLSVFVNSQAQNFSITMINELTWLIEPVYLKDISENSSLEILMIGYIVSKNNSLLSTSKLSSVLYPLKSQILANQIFLQKIAAVKATAQQAATASGAFLGSVILLNLNIIFLFQFQNAIEMFNSIKFFSMDLDPLFLQFVSTFENSFKLPSMFDHLFNSDDGVAIPTKYKKLDIDTNLILINSGTNLTILCAIFVVILIVFIIKGIMWLLFKKKTKMINKSLIFKLSTWFYIQTLSDFTLNSIIGIYLCKFENSTQIIDFCCCIFVIVINK